MVLKHQILQQLLSENDLQKLDKMSCVCAANPDSERSNESLSDTEKCKTPNLDNGFQCPNCPKKTLYYSHLLTHAANVHFADKLSVEKSQKQCHLCEKSCTTYCNLVNWKLLLLSLFSCFLFLSNTSLLYKYSKLMRFNQVKSTNWH